MSSNIRSVRVDLPVRLDASWSPTRADRRDIDDQILGVQQHIVDSLLSGYHATWVLVDGGSQPLNPGDLVCTVATNGGIPTVTLAYGAALAAAGAVFGVVLNAAQPFAKVRIAFNGVIPNSITGLAALQGVCVANTDGTCLRLVAATTADYVVGTIDAAGNLTIAKIIPASGNMGDLIVGGDIGGPNSAPKLIHITGPTVNPLGVSATKWTFGPSTNFPFPFAMGSCQTVGTPTATPTVVNLAIGTNTSTDVFGTVVGRDAASADTYRATISALVKRTTGAPTISGSTTLTPHPDNPAATSTWSVTLTANGTSDGIIPVCHGQASKTIDWSIYLQHQSISSGVPSVAPSIAAVTPNHGPQAGGTPITIDGIRFTGTNTTNGVKINGVNCTSIVVVSDIQITCVSPVGASSGATTIVVDNGLGTDSAAYTYDAASSYAPLTDFGAGNCTFWSAGDNGNFTNSGGYVTTIADASGLAQHFGSYSGSPDQRGPYVASSINGKPTVQTGVTRSATAGPARYGTPSATTLFQLDDYFGATMADFTAIVVINAPSITHNTPGTAYSGDGIIGDVSANWGIYLHNRSGGVVQTSIYNSAEHATADVACSTGSPHVIAVRRTGGNLYLSVDGGTEASVASAAPASTGTDMYIGTGWNFNYSEAKIAEVILWKANSSSACASTVAALKTKYGI